MLIDKLALIEIQNRKVLSTLSKGKDTYYLPGGKREVGESDEAALIREIKEELTVDIIPSSIQFLGIFEDQAHGHTAGVKVKMTCYTAKFIGQLNPAAEIEKIAWLNTQDKHRVSPVDKIIFDYLLSKNLID